MVCVMWWLAQPAGAINIQLNYSYDTTGFFANAQAKAALEAAAGFYSTILTDTFDAITVPNPYPSTFPGSNGVVHWSWDVQFQHPSDSSPNEVTITSPVIASDQYVIYVGARPLSGNTAGEGGPGGYSTASTTVTGTNSFTQSDIQTINSRTATLNQAITTRGETEPNTFVRWGGVLTFDNDGSTSWHLNHLQQPIGNVTDFYSIAIHELGHALGFGTSDEWMSFVDEPNVKFVGNHAMAQNGIQPVPLAAFNNLGHWLEGKQSVIYGTATAQEAAMDPSVLNGTRKRLTELDAAALKDIGWTLGPAPGVDGDYNNNGIVDAADYAVWRKRLNQNVTLPNDTTPGSVLQVDYGVWRSNFGKTSAGAGTSGGLLASGDVPEPASCVLAAAAVMVTCAARRKPRRLPF